MKPLKEIYYFRTRTGAELYLRHIPRKHRRLWDLVNYFLP